MFADQLTTYRSGVDEVFAPYIEIRYKNIQQAILNFGGVWMTPDLDTQVDMQAAAARNAFIDDAAVLHFFTEMGFTVEIQRQFDSNVAISSLKGNPLPR